MLKLKTPFIISLLGLCAACCGTAPVDGSEGNLLQPESQIFVDASYGFYRPPDTLGVNHSFHFFERTEESEKPVLMVEYRFGGWAKLADFQLDFLPTSISGPASNSSIVLVGGRTHLLEAVLYEFQFDFSSGKPRLVDRKRFGDTSGLTVISDFVIEDEHLWDSVVALDGRLGQLVRISRDLPPLGLVDQALSAKLVGMKSIMYSAHQLGAYYCGISKRYANYHGGDSHFGMLLLKLAEGKDFFLESNDPLLH